MLYSLVLVLIAGGFLKVCLSLVLLTYGFGLRDFASSIIALLLAVVLSFWSLETNLKSAGGLEKTLMSTPLSDQATTALKDLVTAQADPKVLAKLQEQKPENAFTGVMVASSLGQLKSAFELGLLLLIPFLIIDLLVVNGLNLLGITQFSPVILGLPCKLLLFLSVGGWDLLFQKLLGVQIVS